MKKLMISLCLFTQTLLCFGQSPYHYNPTVEASLLFLGGLAIGVGEYAQSKEPVFTVEDLSELDANDINSFDRSTTENLSLTANRISDILVVGSIPVALTFLLGPTPESENGMMLALWGETMVVTAGLTQMTKSIAQRARPFVYNPDAAEKDKMKENSKASFFSGHTSITAANSFLCAKIFSDYNPDSKWRPYVWTVAALVPAATGYLRTAAGKHFPTDVITGYLVGASIGILVPCLHKTKTKKNDKVSFLLGPTGGHFSLKF